MRTLIQDVVWLHFLHDLYLQWRWYSSQFLPEVAHLEDVLLECPHKIHSCLVWWICMWLERVCCINSSCSFKYANTCLTVSMCPICGCARRWENKYPSLHMSSYPSSTAQQNTPIANWVDASAFIPWSDSSQDNMKMESLLMIRCMCFRCCLQSCQGYSLMSIKSKGKCYLG